MTPIKTLSLLIIVAAQVSCSSQTASKTPPAPAFPAANPVPVPSERPVAMGTMVPDRTATAPTPSPSATAASPALAADLPDRIARQIIAASPPADPGDTKARDEAATRLGACTDLLAAAGDKILWGGFNVEQGYDPAAYRLTESSPLDYYQLSEFSPSVWAKLYLSTFMFNGKYQIKSEGGFTVVELEAHFRDGLDPGDYPYPFWHNVNKWTAYCNADKVALVFDSGRLVSGLRVAPPPLALVLKKKTWDGKWMWSDANGQAQPRAALFTYMFSKNNPHLKTLDRTFRDLEESLRAQNCVLCHLPDNRSHMNELLLLNYPNQALVARHALKDVIARNEMPPGSLLAHEAPGIHDEPARQKLLRLAEAFEKEADAAMQFEASATAPH